MSDEDKQKTLGYQPDIKYQDEYGTDYEGFGATSVDLSDTEEIDDDIYDNTVMDSIQNNIDEIIFYINGLPVELQTAVNQVFKPVYLEWHKNFKKNNYPKRIPNTYTPKITINTGGGSTPGPGGGGGKPGGGGPGGISPGGPGGGGKYPEGEIPGYVIPDVPELPDPIPPVIWSPEPDDPIIPIPGEVPPVYPPFDEEGDLFTPASPFIVTYEEIDENDQVKLEYIKNLADLFKFYTDILKDTIKAYFTSYISSILAAVTTEELAFVREYLNLDAINVNEDLRHLIDSTVRSEIMGSNKLSFYLNVFTVEKSLYHLKSFITAYQLRLRYTEEEPKGTSNKLDSISDNILGTMKDIYSKKYDITYCDLHKYLYSSVQVLDDALKTVAIGLKSKEILLRKGGID